MGELTNRFSVNKTIEYTVKPILRGHIWDKEKNHLFRQVTS
jgi:hypothetical protein